MTNEEAINKIKYRIDTASRIAGTGADGKEFEDLEMAIQALGESKEIRNKTIDEFAGLLTEILESWAEINRMAFAIHSNDCSYLTTAKAYDRVVNLINEMAEDAKGESDDT